MWLEKLVGKKTWEDMEKAALDKNPVRGVLANLSGGPGCGVGGGEVIKWCSSRN